MSAKLHEALKTLRPKDWSEVPKEDLKLFLRDIFAQAEVIANSIPPPPGGDDFVNSKRSRSDINGARKASELTVSSARPPPPDPAHVELRKAWGKPLKVNPKDNPHGLAVWKMAASDRHGAWFARSSVHEGLGFTKWKKAMQREFAESLEVQGGPGEGNVRGIGGDRRLEKMGVEGVGKLEVYQLSAQFPGPTSPREFITLLLTSDCALSDASTPHLENGNAPKQVPRHWMVVSIPITHPDAPPRDGFIRGQYESVELIREIPLTPPKSASTVNLNKSGDEPTEGRKRGSIPSFAEFRGPDTMRENIDKQEPQDDDEIEGNPVEWIMITRSDPGGGIPRFMVERGTPSSIVADAGKFLDWACAKDLEDLPSESETEDRLDSLTQDRPRKSIDSTSHYSVSQANGYLAGVGTSIADKQDRSLTAEYEQPQPHQQGGIISSLTNVIETGIASYAPESLQSYLPNQVRRESDKPDQDSESDTTETSSMDSFASAEQFNTAEEAPPYDKRDPRMISSDSLSLNSPAVSGESPAPGGTTHHDRELAKLDKKKQHLKEKLEKSREKEEERTREVVAKDEKEAEKAKEKHDRELRKQEEKYQKEVRKLEARKQKEQRKLEERRRKEADKNTLLKTQRERDEWKAQAEFLSKENKILKEQVGELQRENTVLVAKFGKTEAGQSALRQVLGEMERSRGRGSSMSSLKSKKSSEHSAEDRVIAGAGQA